MIFLVIFCCVHFPMFASMRHAYIPLEAKSYNTFLYTPTPEQIQADPDFNLNQVFLEMEDDRVWFPEEIDKTLYFQTEITLHT